MNRNCSNLECPGISKGFTKYGDRWFCLDCSLDVGFDTSKKQWVHYPDGSLRTINKVKKIWN